MNASELKTEIDRLIASGEGSAAVSLLPELWSQDKSGSTASFLVSRYEEQRSKLNLIADDYTQRWPDLDGLRGPQPLSAWLAVIRDRYGFQVVRDGDFLRVRNRRWWLDRRYEVPTRLLTR